MRVCVHNREGEKTGRHGERDMVSLSNTGQKCCMHECAGESRGTCICEGGFFSMQQTALKAPISY